ncbi:MAG TPA: Crp/Fnr family transcriptional regulator [Bryobacteraceae bacterium]|nr:Crp/Fnr family transcriptional regulator [Bryobacteraceae bacterium]
MSSLSIEMSDNLQAVSNPIRDELIHLDGVQSISLRRQDIIFSPEKPAACLYVVESGFIKLGRLESSGREVIVRIAGPGDLCGEYILWATGQSGLNGSVLTAEVIQDATLYAISRDAFMRHAESHPQVWRALAEILATRERELEKRVALLALRDVEYRILFFLAELACLFGSGSPGDCPLPVTQRELACYVGATRETTSSTLNALARRGLVRLGRRLLIVPSVEALRSALQERSVKAVAGSL